MVWRGDNTGRVARSLLTLFDQVDAHYPGRDRSSDGTLGNAAHQATKSDHNIDDHGIVRALDITHDPAHGFDSYKFADFLREHWDDRVQFIISNRRIANIDVGFTTWRPYTGQNPHDHHVHISARADERADDSRAWDLEPFFGGSPPAPPPPKEGHVLIKKGDKGPAVTELQTLLGVGADGDFGPNTDAAVLAFQTSRGLSVDGEVGPKTWAALLAGSQTQPANVQTSKGSWYSQYKGKYTWVDNEDAPNSAALGCPDDAQGVAMPTRATLGHWFVVRAPNGKVSLEQVTDLGPSTFTGRTIDISAAAAERFGYSPQNFPTDQIFTFWPVEPPPQVASLKPKDQATAYRDIRKDIKMAEPTEQPKPPVNPVPQPKPAPQPQVPAVLSPKLDVLQGLHYIVSGQRDKVREDLKLFLDVFNSKHPDIPIALPAVPAPAPSSGSLLDRPSVQIGGIGLFAAGLSFVAGFDPNLTLLAGIVSLATAALGPAGGVVGSIIMNIARAAMAASQNKPPQQ